MATAMEKFLKGQKDQFEAGVEAFKNRKNDFPVFPDGTYVTQVSGAEIGESKAGNLQIVWKYVILEGALSGEIIRDYEGMEGERSWEFIIAKLARYGYDPGAWSPEDLEEILAEIQKEGPVVQLQLKTNKQSANGYQAKYVNTVCPFAKYKGDLGYTTFNTASEDETAPATRPVAAPPVTRSRGRPSTAEKVASAAVSAPAVALTPEPAPATTETTSNQVDIPNDELIGITVYFDDKGTERKGTIKSISDDGERLSVQSGLKIFSVSSADVTLEPSVTA